MLTKELLQELGVILKQEYRISFESKELNKIGEELLSFFEILTKIQSRKELKNKNYYDEYSKRRQKD